MDKLANEYDVRVEWRAFELHPEGPQEGPAQQRDPERVKASRERLTTLAAEAGMEIQFRDKRSNSRLALEAAEYARAQGSLDPLHRTIFHAYWRDGLDIGDASVLAELAGSVGLDGQELAEALEQRKFQEVVQLQVDEAHRLNIRAVPTFIFQGRLAVQGAQPYEVFQQVMEEHVLPAARGEG